MTKSFSYTDLAGDELNRLNKMRGFAEHFTGCSKVLDIGCGRGEFLQALAERGIQGFGIDPDTKCITRCAEKGLDVQETDALAYLSEHAGEYDGIMCSHVIEHLQSNDAQELFARCFSGLKPNGLLVIVTPNSKSLSVVADMFWRDPTHARLYPLPLLEIMLAKEGFIIEKKGDTNKPSLHGLKGMLRRYLLGEYFVGTSAFVIARKK